MQPESGIMTLMQ